MSKSIKSLPKQDRPREKLENIGAENLTDAELIAIVIGSGTKSYSSIDLSQDLLTRFENLAGMFERSLEELRGIKGIGNAKAIVIKAIQEISKRLIMQPCIGAEINKPYDAYRQVRRDLYKKSQEYLFIICLNARNVMIGKELISIGTLSETLVHPREIYKRALEKNAHSVIMIHNHPSGDVKPSSEDLVTTEKIAKAGREIGIPLLDHIIVSDRDFFSLRSANILNYSSSSSDTTPTCRNLTNTQQEPNTRYTSSTRKEVK